MKERPILFSGEMVKAILAGRKTQTRRVLKHREPRDLRAKIVDVDTFEDVIGLYARPTVANNVARWMGDVVYCPFGVPGDHLWVRETWSRVIRRPVMPGESWWPGRQAWPGVPDDRPRLSMPGATGDVVIYRADGEMPGEFKESWKPSIHMPRWASRLTLEVVAVRVERLQDITEADAVAEGMDPGAPWFPPGQWEPPDEDPRQVGYGRGTFALQNFSAMWDHINGKRASWDSNPWVWVVTFRRVS